MKHFYSYLFVFVLLFTPIVCVGQSLEVIKPFEKLQYASVLAMYSKYFQNFENPDVDDKFAYAVIRIKLEGNETQVLAAKEKLSLYLGQHYQPESKIDEVENELIFLVPSSAGTVVLTCGEGCQKQQILSLNRLESDAVYDGAVCYNPVEDHVMPSTKSAQTIQGTILNATTGEPLNGASVVEVGTSKVTITDSNGKFMLAASEGTMLEVTCKDFETKIVSAANNMQIRLNPLQTSDANSTQTIKGTVLNATTGEPLNGASVAEVGTSKVTITDSNGKFMLAAKKGTMIEVSYKDFETKLVYATNNLQIRLNPLRKSKSNSKKTLINTYLMGYAGMSMNLRWGIGLTFGQLYDGLGWYIKGRSNFIFPEAIQGITCNQQGVIRNGDEHVIPFYTDQTANSECVANVGFAMDFLRNVKWRNENNMFGMYVGLGYGHSRLYWQLDGTKDWIMCAPGSITGISVDAGLIASMGGFTLSAGVNTINFHYLEFEVGVGWTF